jgi:single-strand DNA-binding protein
MKGINKVILIGNLGKDPEVNHLEGGLMVAKFPLATSETYTDKNGNRVEQTNGIISYAGGSLARLPKVFKKGSAIYVEGVRKTTKNISLK